MSTIQCHTVLLVRKPHPHDGNQRAETCLRELFLTPKTHEMYICKYVNKINPFVCLQVHL